MAYILALAIGLGSLALYTAAFFFPEVYRKGDFFWSGVGMFYALILWFCAGRITGAVLLGQLAAVMLVLWFGWQNLMLRRYLTPVAEQTQIEEDIKEQLARGMSGVPQLVKTGLKKGEQSSVTPSTTPDGTAAQPESQLETDEALAPPQTEKSRPDEALAPPQTEESRPDEALAPERVASDESAVKESEVISGSRDAEASTEALREKQEKPVQPGKQKSRRFLGLGKIFASVKSRPKKQSKSQPDEKITSSDGAKDKSKGETPPETSAPTASSPVPDVTTSQTSEVETLQAVTELEQATLPQPEETSELVMQPERATAPESEGTSETSAVETSEPVAEPEQATAPEPEETLTGKEAAQEEETTSQATTSDNGSQSAETQAKTDD